MESKVYHSDREFGAKYLAFQKEKALPENLTGQVCLSLLSFLIYGIVKFFALTMIEAPNPRLTKLFGQNKGFPPLVSQAVSNPSAYACSAHAVPQKFKSVTSANTVPLAAGGW